MTSGYMLFKGDWGTLRRRADNPSFIQWLPPAGSEMEVWDEDHVTLVSRCEDYLRMRDNWRSDGQQAVKFVGLDSAMKEASYQDGRVTLTCPVKVFASKYHLALAEKPASKWGEKGGASQQGSLARLIARNGGLSAQQEEENCEEPPARVSGAKTRRSARMQTEAAEVAQARKEESCWRGQGRWW